MKRFSIKAIAMACSLIPLLSLLAGCGGQKTQGTETAGQTTAQTQATTATEKPAEPVKLTVFSASSGRVDKDDNPVILEIGKLNNVELDVTLVPLAEFITKFNLLVASSTVPDITRIAGYDFFNYVPQGAFLDIGPLVEQYGANMKKFIPQSTWDVIKVEGKTYGVPSFVFQGATGYYMRKDWLDNLGLQVPTNLDEYADVLKKFTYNDPDKNGKNDTYGITVAEQVNVDAGLPSTFAMIFGAYGFGASSYYEKDGKVYYPLITPEYKEALAYIAKLMNEDKVVDPDLFILKQDQARQNLAQGRAGSFGGGYMVVPQNLMEQLKMKSINPNAEWVIVPPVKGKDGKSGLLASQQVKAMACVSAKCANPEAAVKLLDFLASDEGTLLATYGIENVHYTKKDGKLEKRTPEGQKAMDEKWIDALAFIVGRMDFSNEMAKITNPTYTPYIETAVNTKPLYANLFEGINTPESVKLNADLKQFEMDWFVSFVTGVEPLTKFDDYVKQWKDKGGVERFDSLLAAYNKNKGTNLTAAY